jgi:hypothetical protein
LQPAIEIAAPRGYPGAFRRPSTCVDGSHPRPSTQVDGQQLLIVVWHVLLGRSADRRADAEQVAFKLMVWAWKLSEEQRGGLSSRQFIGAHLIRLRLRNELTHITRSGTRRPLATIEEVLELRPELRGSPPQTNQNGG